MQVVWVKIGDFRQITGYISKKVQDNFDLFRTFRTSSFCTVAWQLARFQLTRRIARSLGDSWASCTDSGSISCLTWTEFFGDYSWYVLWLNLVIQGQRFGLRSFEPTSAVEHSGCELCWNNCWMRTMDCCWFWIWITLTCHSWVFLWLWRNESVHFQWKLKYWISK